MPDFISTPLVYFIACHGGPADHFATFAQQMDNPVHVCASGPALKKFQERGVSVNTPFSLENLSPEQEDLLAEQIAKNCPSNSVVITDLGHPFDIKVQRALARFAERVKRMAYYDNPESYVPGGYSSIAAKVMEIAHSVLFANANLASSKLFQGPGEEIVLANKQKIGLGYYPIEQAKKIASRRAVEKAPMRLQFFFKNGLHDQGEKLLVYFGGNNAEYFDKALPAFLELLGHSNPSNYMILIQQHPGARSRNIDRDLILNWMDKQPQDTLPHILFSDLDQEAVQIIADAALYYQTSMAPQFALAGIPTIQVGHNKFEDILIRNHLAPSVTNKEQFEEAMHGLTDRIEIPNTLIYNALGINSDWLDILKKTTQLNEGT